MGDNYYGRNREGWVPLVKEVPNAPEQVTEEVSVDHKADAIAEFEREFAKQQEGK